VEGEGEGEYTVVPVQLQQSTVRFQRIVSGGWLVWCWSGASRSRAARLVSRLARWPSRPGSGQGMAAGAAGAGGAEAGAGAAGGEKLRWKIGLFCMQCVTLTSIALYCNVGRRPVC
jgi:hypothetical protein